MRALVVHMHKWCKKQQNKLGSYMKGKCDSQKFRQFVKHTVFVC